MAAKKHPPFDLGQLEQIAKTLGDTEKGLSGIEIDHFLENSSIENISPGITKWKRLYNAFINSQNTILCANHVINFIRLAMTPSRYTGDTEKFKILQEKLNKTLFFSGFELQDDGMLHTVAKSNTLSDAVQRAARFKSLLEIRNVHADVLEFANAEIIQDNYFHAVFEAMKSISYKLRQLSCSFADGSDLVDFSLLGNEPAVIINEYHTQTQIGEQKGFANILKGLYGTFRNPLSHESKIKWEMNEQDALDIMSTISLIHRKLDKARRV
jgi:uncharacterized protein (TIGR02391 family)